MPDRRLHSESGFTLLEVMIALVIASLALVVLYEGGVTGVTASHIAAHYQEAVSRARSRLELITHGGSLAPGDWRGDDGGGFQWRAHVAPVAQTTIPAAVTGLGRKSAIALYAVTVWVSWDSDGHRREVRLDTEQIGNAVTPH